MANEKERRAKRDDAETELILSVLGGRESMTAKLSNRTTRCPWILSPGDTKAIRFDSIPNPSGRWAAV